MIKSFIHWIAHKLGYNQGNVVTWQEDGKIYVAFKCDCGLIDPSSIDCIESDKFYE